MRATRTVSSLLAAARLKVRWCRMVTRPKSWLDTCRQSVIPGGTIVSSDKSSSWLDASSSSLVVISSADGEGGKGGNGGY